MGLCKSSTNVESQQASSKQASSKSVVPTSVLDGFANVNMKQYDANSYRLNNDAPEPWISKCHWIVPDRILCGRCPDQTMIDFLPLLGIRDVISLLNKPEHDEKYNKLNTNNITILEFPIVDFKTPDRSEAKGLIINILREIRNGKRFYIHCLAGHGRTGTMVIMLVQAIYGGNLRRAQVFVNKLHVATCIQCQKDGKNLETINEGTDERYFPLPEGDTNQYQFLQNVQETGIYQEIRSALCETVNMV